LKRAELKTKEYDTPHFVRERRLLRFHIRAEHRVLGMYDTHAHELLSCIQTDSEEVIGRFICRGVALRTRRIEGAAHLFIKYDLLILAGGERKVSTPL
jgi:hypothetical protein